MDPILTQILAQGGPTAVVAVAGVVLIFGLLRLEHARQAKLLGHIGRLTRSVRQMARAIQQQSHRVESLGEKVESGDGCAAKPFFRPDQHKGDHS